jgi:hypothetical protein
MLKEFTSLINRGTFEYKEYTNKKLILLVTVLALARAAPFPIRLSSGGLARRYLACE